MVQTGSASWYFADAGQRQGPVTLDQLVETIRDGRLAPGALVWRPGLARWTPAEGVQEIAARLRPTPPAASGPRAAPPASPGVPQDDAAARAARLARTRERDESAHPELRFVPFRCQIRDAGLHLTLQTLRGRDVAWSDVARVVVRQLPVEPPWGGLVLLDLVTARPAGGWAPVRILETTVVNYAALPGGPATARIENLRRLALLARERQPELAVDVDTQAFLDGGPVPRFATGRDFIQYDDGYDAPR
jgi:hypothetical protein